MDRLFGWLRIGGVRGWQLGGVAVGVFVLWTLFQKLLLLVVTGFIAVLIAALLVPVSRWLERLGVPRGLAAATAIVGGTFAVLGVAVLIGMRIADQVPQLTQEFEQVRRNVTAWLKHPPLDVTEQQLQDAIDQVITYVQNSWTSIASRAFGALVAVGAFLTALVLAFFLVRDRHQINGWILDRLVARDQRELVAAVGARAGDALQSYIQAVVVIGALDAFFIGLTLVIMNVPLAVPLAVLTFFGAFFPVVGATVAGALAAIVATVSGGIVQGLVVLAVVVVVQQVDGNILQPVIMGRAVHLHPIVVLGALSAGGIVAGLIGAFMAVPVTAVLVAMGHEVRQRRDQEALKAAEADATSGGVT